MPEIISFMTIDCQIYLWYNW